MLDSNLIAILVTKLFDSNENVCQLAAQAMAELAKHGASSDPGSMQTLIQNQRIQVTPCWILTQFQASSSNRQLLARLSVIWLTLQSMLRLRIQNGSTTNVCIHVCYNLSFASWQFLPYLVCQMLVYKRPLIL